MKRILILIILFGTFSAFSQTEIWGVKQFDGANRGGFLYTIDSATKKIQVQHRFLSLYPNSSENSFLRPFYSKASNSYLFMIQGSLIKFNVLSSEIQEVNLGKNIYGELFELDDSTVYGIYNEGVVKINPITFEFVFIKENEYTNLRTDIGFEMLDNQHLLFQVDEELNIGKIKVLDLENDHISDFYIMNSPEIGFHPYGKIRKIGNNFYGALRVVDLPDRYFQIFKFTPSNNQFEIILSLKNKYLTQQRMNGIELLSNNTFFSLAAISENSKKLVAFYYNPINNKLDSLSIIPDDIGSDIDQNLVVLNDTIILSATNSGLDYDNGCIFSFNLNTRHFEPIFIKDSTTKTNKNMLYSALDESNILIIKPQLIVDDIFNIISFNTRQRDENWHYGINDMFPLYKGSNPYDIIQLENGNILGTAQNGGNPTTISPYDLGKGLLFEFNPRNKEYSVIQHFDTFNLNYYYPTELFKVSANQYVGILHSENSNISTNQGKYLYNSTDKSVRMLPFFPWSGLQNDYAQINDSSVFVIPRNGNSFDQNCIIKYNLLSDEYDTVVYMDMEYRISNLLLENNNLIYHVLKKNGTISDSSFVYQLNLQNSSTSQLFCVNEIIDDTTITAGLSFNYIKDGIIKGNLMMRKANYEKIITELYSLSYNLNTEETNIYRTHLYGGDYSFEDFELDYFYNLNEDSDETYVVRDFSDENDAGDISIVNPDNNLEIIDVFEQFEGEYTGGFGILRNPFGLKLFKKMDYSKHWVGEINSDWYEPKNWTGMQIPDSTDLITIDAYVLHFPMIDTLVKCKSIIISPHASISVQPNGMLDISEDVYNHGQIKLYADDRNRASFIHQKDFSINTSTSYEYISDTGIKQLVASPMETEGFRFSELAQIYSYAEEGLEWNPVQNYPFYPEIEKAYFYDQQFRTLSFKGDLNHLDYQIDIPYSSETRMYPIPNPYAASIDWTELDLSQLRNKALYRFSMEDSTYVPFVDGLGWETPLIQPLDVIWIYSSGNESINFYAADRFHAGLKELEIDDPEKELIISVSGSGGADQTIISFNNMSSAEFDGDYDAVKSILSPSEKPRIFTKTSNELLSVNQLPDTSMMELFFESGERGYNTISIDKSKGFDFVVLEDLIWNKRINLLEQDYRFEYFESDGHYPFKLYFNQWAMEPVAENDIQIYYYPESIVVRSAKQIEVAQILFYDLSGRMVLDFQEKDFHYFEKPVTLPTGHYIVQLRTGDLVVNKKVLVRR